MKEKWFVDYKVYDKEFSAGPYDSEHEAEQHLLDIKGYVGVKDCKLRSEL